MSEATRAASQVAGAGVGSRVLSAKRFAQQGMLRHQLNFKRVQCAACTGWSPGWALPCGPFPQEAQQTPNSLYIATSGDLGSIRWLRATGSGKLPSLQQEAIARVYLPT